MADDERSSLHTAVEGILRRIHNETNNEGVQSFLEALLEANGRLQHLKRRHCRDKDVFKEWLYVHSSESEQSSVGTFGLDFVARELVESLQEEGIASHTSGTGASSSEQETYTAPVSKNEETEPVARNEEGRSLRDDTSTESDFFGGGYQVKLMRPAEISDAEGDSEDEGDVQAPVALQSSESFENPTATTELGCATSQAELEQAVNGLRSGDPIVTLDSVTHIRKCLSVPMNPPIQTVIELGAVPLLVEFLDQNSFELRYESAWALTNIASGASEHVQCIVDAGVTSSFLRMMSSDNKRLKEQAVWGLGNIAGDGRKFSLLLFSQDIMNPLSEVIECELKEGDLPLLRNSTFLLLNLCRAKPHPNELGDTIDRLRRLVSHDDMEVKKDACWAISYLTDGENDRIETILSADMLDPVIRLLSTEDNNFVIPALRTMGNMVSGDDFQTQRVLDHGALPILRSLLNCKTKSIRKESCWALSNIAAGRRDHVEALIAANIIPRLLRILKEDEFDVRKEAVWTITNAFSGLQDVGIVDMIEAGCLPALVSVLPTFKDDPIAGEIMSALNKVLKQGETHQVCQCLEKNPFLERLKELNIDPILVDLIECESYVAVAANIMRDRYFGMELTGC